MEIEDQKMRDSVAEVLREMRAEAGLTQEQLAAKIGKTKQAVSRYENGAYFPAMTVLIEIAKYCGYSMGEVFDMAAQKLGENTSPSESVIKFLRAEVEATHKILNDAGVSSIGKDQDEVLSLSERVRIAINRT
jgi:transcriptional regulator with XRE-family HTH domain